MPLIVVVAVFVNIFLTGMIMKKFFNATMIRTSWSVGGGRREGGRLCTVNVISCRYVGARRYKRCDNRGITNVAQMHCNIIVDVRNKPLSLQMEAFIYFLLQL